MIHLLACWALLLLLPSTLLAQKAAPSIRFEVRDGDGAGLAGAEIVVFNDFDRYSSKTNSQGTATLTLANNEYSLEVWYRGEKLASNRLLANQDNTLTFELPIYKFRVQVSTANGDLLEGARASFSDASGKTIEAIVNNGKIEGLARAGKVVIQLTWNAQTLDITTLQLPAKRSDIVELEVVNLDVQLVQKDTGLGFGPALLAAASQGNDFPGGTWTSHDGKLTLAVFPGALRVRAQWFDQYVIVDTKAPGAVKVPMALASKSIAAPDDGPRVPYLAQLRQPGFQVWANGDPLNGIRLPLPAGKFDVTIFDEKRQPLFRGIATVTADQPQAQVSWQKASGAVASELAERRLDWPRGIWNTPPSAALQEGPEWRPVLVSDSGSLGLLPPGMHLRVPNNALGKTYLTEGTALSVQLGVLEINLPKAERIKIFSADQPDLTLVENCKTLRCRIALPPGKYLVYAPAAQLIKEPVAVEHGQIAYVYAKSQ